MGRPVEKDLQFEQVSRIGKAVSSPKRLALLDLLIQGEKSVEALAAELDIDIRLASAHLRELRQARLVASRRDGRRMIYRLSGDDVLGLWLKLRDVALEHLAEFRVALDEISNDPERLVRVGRAELIEQARRGEIVVLDVRPEAEYAAAHLPYARSMPLAELERRVAELPRNREIVAYCRGPFCLLSNEAVQLLSARGFDVRKLLDGIGEWQAAGMPVERTAPA